MAAPRGLREAGRRPGGVRAGLGSAVRRRAKAFGQVGTARPERKLESWVLGVPPDTQVVIGVAEVDVHRGLPVE